MLKKLRRRFVITAMTAFGIVMLLLIAGINILNYFQFAASQREKLNGILEYEQLAAEQPETDRPPISEMEWAGGPGSEFTVRFFVVTCDETGYLRAFGSEYINSVDEETAEAYSRAVLDLRKDSGRYGDYRYLITVGDEDLVIVFLNIAEDMYAQKTLLLVSALIGVSSLAAVFLLILLFSGTAVRPFVRNIEQQKRFITDASHELKTPITAIAAAADVSLLEFGENEWLQSIRQQAERLSRLVNDLVTLSRLDEVNPLPEKAEFSLTEAAWEIAEPFETRAKANGKLFSAEIEEGLTLCGDRESVQKLISILLDNAVRYSDDGGIIRVKLFRNRSRTVLEVYNTCSLLPDIDLNRLFDRFYRPDESRSVNTGGSGIGLSIARAIAENHGGKIKAESTDRRSVTFRVTI